MRQNLELASKMLEGDRNALARLISLAEEDSPELPAVMESLMPRLGKAHCIGITGMPGAGKSSLVDRLISVVRGKGRTVGIIAVDPSSPFSGGAVLGDRLRMQRHCADSGVFIRSMATRGAHGGLPATVLSVAKLMDAYGKDHVIIETAGVGQTELDIMKMADTIVVVLTPEAGDTIQSLKAGLLEIADIFVVNKADRPGADQMVQNLMALVNFPGGRVWWKAPVLATQAINGAGVEDLWREIERHRETKRDKGYITQSRKERRCQEFRDRVQGLLFARTIARLGRNHKFDEYLNRVASQEIDPSSAASQILKEKAFWDEWAVSVGEDGDNFV